MKVTRPLVQTDEEIKNLVDTLGGVTQAIIADAASLIGVPGTSLLAGAFQFFWNEVISKEIFRGSKTLKEDLELIMDWVENYVEDKISELVRGEINTQYKAYSDRSNEFSDAVYSYSKSDSHDEKDKMSVHISSLYDDCKNKLNDIILKCTNYPEDQRYCVIWVYNLCMISNIFLLKDGITMGEFWGLINPELNRLKRS